MKRPDPNAEALPSEYVDGHLLVLAGAARAPGSLSHRGDGCETTFVQLGEASLDELVKFAEQTWTRVTIVVPGWAHLRAVAVPARLLGATTDLKIRMTQDASRSQQPALGALTLRPLDVIWRTRRDGTLDLDIVSERPLAIVEALQAVIGPDRGPLRLPLRVGLADRAAEAFVIGNPHVRYVGVDDVVVSAGNDLAAVDVVLQSAEAATEPITGATAQIPRLRVLSPDATEAVPADMDPALALPAVDTWVINPTGFLAHDHAAHVTTISADDPANGTLLVNESGGTLLHVRPGAPLTRRQLSRARGVRFIRTLPNAYPSPVAHARLLSQLAAAGVPVVGDALTESVRALLGAEVSAAIDDVSANLVRDPLLREVASIRLRRAALRNHSPGSRARRHARLAGLPVRSLPPVSVVLVTRRPTFLRSALAQVARQTYEELELVLGLHGEAFDDADVTAALAEFPRSVTVVRIPSTVTFGEALNQATTAASADYFTKWDDDDLYGAHHVEDLMLAADYSQATIVGKGTEFIQLDDIGATVGGRNPVNERRVRFVAGGTLLLTRQTLAELGGWRPLSFAVDQALLRMVRDAGGTIYRTHGMGYVLRRHGQDHTWDAATEYFLDGQSRQWPTGSWRQQVVVETDLSLARDAADAEGEATGE